MICIDVIYAFCNHENVKECHKYEDLINCFLVDKDLMNMKIFYEGTRKFHATVIVPGL